jgi:transposase
MSNFRLVDRDTDFLLPPSVNEWLPQRHLARFVVEVVEQLDVSNMSNAYRGSGSAAYHPQTLLGLLIYGYATGVFSSRKIERATYDSVAFRFIAANQHPDHDTLATFRKRFLSEIEGLFVSVLELAGQMGVLKLGTVALDGTKVQANASRHSALSYGHVQKIEAQLRREVQELLALAEQADAADMPDDLLIPEELERREARLARIDEAKAEIEARAAQRFAEEQAAHEAKLAAREEKTRRTGKKPRGKAPTPPSPGARPSDQVNLTDPESRIMKTPQGFEQCYNAQAAVDTQTMLIVHPGLTQAGNDKQQVEPMLKPLADLPEALGRVETLLADTGYCSERNIELTHSGGIEPLIAVGRASHHPSWRERFTEPPPLDNDASALEAMAHRLKTSEGRALYALRKQTVEPVFGIVKSAIGFRQFLLRGLDNARGEWSLMSTSWNIKRLFALQPT